MAYCKPFTAIGKKDVGIAGGKAASLGEMIQAGFAVPQGFVLLATAFEEFISNHPQGQDIALHLQRVNTDDMNSIEKASVTIQDIIHDVAINNDVEKEVMMAFTALDTPFVAVRSSATAEDSQIASWAGELDTFLFTTEETLIQNIKKCWASLYSPRAIFYRMENKLEDATVSVAVAVQEMVNSEVAGVAFSVHPVTKDTNHIIIEAGLGLGEAVVSGQITPDNYIIAKDTKQIVDRYVSTQSLLIQQKKDGGTETVEVEEVEGSRQKLSDQTTLLLAEQVLAIEKHYGFPVDVEWALAKNQLYITQARPITTL